MTGHGQRSIAAGRRPGALAVAAGRGAGALAVAAGAAWLAGCAVAPARPARPEAELVDARACAWQLQTVGPLRVRTQECSLHTGHWHVRGDPLLPGFRLWRDDEPVTVVVQAFAKGRTAPPESLMPELKARGLVPDDPGCEMVSVALRPTAHGRSFYQIRPTGERLRAFEATPADQVPEPPCGALGWSTHGVRYFLTDARRPEWMVFVDEGQDGTLIDPDSVEID